MLKDVLSAATQRRAFPPRPAQSTLGPRLREAGGQRRCEDAAVTVTQTAGAPEE